MKKGCRMAPLSLNKFRSVSKTVLAYNMRKCYVGKIAYVISILYTIF